MNLVFIGASNFSLRCFNLLQKMLDINICGVLTAPREFNISYSKEKKVTNVLYANLYDICKDSQIPCIELQGKMNDPEIYDSIVSWNPEVILVVGWYHMVPKKILEIPQKGTLGMHASLLPLYRGGAPLVWAMIQGEKEVGLSLFYFDEGVDTGDIIGQIPIQLKFNDSIKDIYEKVEMTGLDLLREMLPQLARGTAPRKKQDSIPKGFQAVWPQRSPEDGLINWEKPSLEIYNFIRAQTKPYPGAFCMYKGERLKVWECKIYDWSPKTGKPGEVLAVIKEGPLKGILVASANNDSPLLFTEIQINDDCLCGIEFALKRGVKAGDIFSDYSSLEKIE